MMLFITGANNIPVTDVSHNGNAGMTNIRRVYRSLIKHDTGVLRILE